MSYPSLSAQRVRNVLNAAKKCRVLVVGDVMLDQFIWGSVARISPEAPVPVVEFERESFMPGGAANAARNLTALRVNTELFGAVGHDEPARRLAGLLEKQCIGCTGLISHSSRATSLKTRIVAHKQQVVRIDRETRAGLDDRLMARLMDAIKPRLNHADAVIICDYGKGVVTQHLLNEIKALCRARGVWLSLDPKPYHLNLSSLSLITPNRKEAFDLADLPDDSRNPNPLADSSLMKAAEHTCSTNFDRPSCSLRSANSACCCASGIESRFTFPLSRVKSSMSPARAIPSLPPSPLPSPPVRPHWKPPFFLITPPASSSESSAPLPSRRKS